MEISYIRHSAVNLAGAHDPYPEWTEVGQVSEGEEGRKIVEVGEGVRVEVFCDKMRQHMRHDAGMTNYF